MIESRRRQSGMTMIELMMAVLIGLLVSLVIAQLFLGSRESARAIDDSGRMQENARYAFQIIGRASRMASFRADFTRSTDQTFGTGVSAIQVTNGSGTASDTLVLRFTGTGLGTSNTGCATTIATACANADNQTFDCLGRAIDRNVVSVNTFAIRTGANGGPSLQCSINNGTTWTELVPDVENMQILLGDPTSTDIAVNRYLPASDASLQIANVLNMRVALLHRSPSPSKAINEARSYDLLGTTVTPGTDGRSRIVATSDFVLRNRAP